MRVIRNTSEWSVSAGRGRPTIFRSVQPDEEDLPSYLMTLRGFLKGHCFHADPEKAAELRRYVAPGILLLKQEFLNFVIEATCVISGTAYTIKAALREGAVA